LQAATCAAARQGLVHADEGHWVFTQIPVTDNLLLPDYDLPWAERMRRVEEVLDTLAGFAAKRQTLGLAQGLVQRPRLLMLGDPSAGLSPVLVDRVPGVVRALKAQGTAVPLVES
jgi:branched-chain amino acid transport system ATP-binding protein